MRKELNNLSDRHRESTPLSSDLEHKCDLAQGQGHDTTSIYENITFMFGHDTIFPLCRGTMSKGPLSLQLILLEWSSKFWPRCYRNPGKLFWPNIGPRV
jgi:hypothetical protein